MKVCPECKQSFDSSIEECPDDGAALIDSPEALPPNPEPREVQLVRPDEAVADRDVVLFLGVPAVAVAEAVRVQVLEHALVRRRGTPGHQQTEEPQEQALPGADAAGKADA